MVNAGENKKPRDHVEPAVAAPLAPTRTGAVAGAVPAGAGRGHGRGRGHGSGPAQHAVRPRQVPPQPHHMLAVGIGDGFADRRFRPRRPPGQHGRHRAQSQHAQNLALHPHGHQSVPQRGIDHSVAHGIDHSVAPDPDPDPDPDPAPAGLDPDPDPDPAPAGLDTPDQLDEIIRRRPHPPQRARPRQRYTLVAQGDFGQFPATVLRPDEVVGGDADVSEEDLVESVLASHIDEGAHLDTRCAHRADEVRDARMLRRGRIGARQHDAPFREMGVAGPHLLPVDDVVVAVALGRGAQRRQVGARTGLAEQLAPELLARQQRPQPPFLLFRRPGVEQRRPGPPDADGVDGPAHPGRPQLVVDDQLGQRIGVAAEGSGPVRHHVARFSQQATGRLRVGRQPLPYIAPAGIIISGQAEVHPRKRRLEVAPRGRRGTRHRSVG